MLIKNQSRKSLESLELVRFLPVIFLVETLLVSIALYLQQINEKSGWKFFVENTFLDQFYGAIIILGFLITLIYFIVMSVVYAKTGKSLRLKILIFLILVFGFFLAYNFYLTESGGRFSIFSFKNISDDNEFKATSGIVFILGSLSLLAYPIIHCSFLVVYFIKKVILRK